MENYQLFFVESVSGEKIPCIRSKQGEYRLNSIYYPKEAAEEYAERFLNDSNYKIFAIVGFADGMIIREFLKKSNQTNLFIIYEPNAEYFEMLKEIDTFEDIFQDERVHWVVGDGENGELEDVIKKCITSGYEEKLENCILPAYDILYPRECEYFIELLCQRREWILLVKSTERLLCQEMRENLLWNMKDMLKNHTVNQLVREIKKNLSNIPAIIVGAGPSLDKNIHILKKAKGKSFIIAVDAALKKLFKENIEPDIVVTIDSHIGGRWLEEKSVENIPLAVYPKSAKSLIQLNHGKHFYSDMPNLYMHQLYAKTIGEIVVDLETAGSVSTTAFSLARICGFQKIVFIGQDLAFTGGRSYTKEIIGNDKDNEEYLQKRLQITVKDVYGEDVQTDIQMAHYLHWLEHQIKRYPDLQVIDATEGGAFIEGTELMTLESVVEKYCNESFPIKEIIDSIPPAFNEMQRAELQKELDEMPQKLEQLKLIFIEGIRCYENLKKYKSKKYLDEVAKINQEIGKELLIEFLYDYSTAEIHKVEEVAYRNTEVDTVELAEQGIALLQGYIHGIEIMQQDIIKLKAENDGK